MVKRALKEKDVKLKVKELFKKYGVWYFMPSMNGMGRAGVPDFITCIEGYFVAVETKAGKNDLTELQALEIQNIRNSGGRTLVINETNLVLLEDIIRSIKNIDGRTL